jgi:hypothetical protein
MLKDQDFGGRILRWYDLPRPSESSEEQRSVPNAVRCRDVFTDGHSLLGVRYFLLRPFTCTTETCGSRLLRPAGIPSNHAAKRNRRQTPVGTEVQAKLVVGTMGDGAVFPKNAIFSGKVIESVANTSTELSRLAIRMDSVQWKDGSAAVKIYLTAWIYPTTVATGQDLQYGPQQCQVATWNGEGVYPDPNSPVVKPFPGGDSKDSDAVPNTTSAVTLRRRVPMKGVMSGKHDDGAAVIASTHSDIELDKLTTYVFAADELRASK